MLLAIEYSGWTLTFDLDSSDLASPSRLGVPVLMLKDHLKKL
jgi:hypothetical protein